MLHVGAAESVAELVHDGPVTDLLDQIREATEAFWHLLVLLLRQWAAHGAIDIELMD